MAACSFWKIWSAHSAADLIVLNSVRVLVAFLDITRAHSETECSVRVDMVLSGLRPNRCMKSVPCQGHRCTPRARSQELQDRWSPDSIRRGDTVVLSIHANAANHFILPVASPETTHPCFGRLAYLGLQICPRDSLSALLTPPRIGTYSLDCSDRLLMD